MSNTSELHLSSPYEFGWVFDKALREVTLDTADHIMIRSVPAFANDSESMVLHDRGTTDSTQETLLHTASETENGDLWRGLNRIYVSDFNLK